MNRSAQSPLRPELDPTLDFLRLLWSIENCLQSTSKRMASSLGITGPQRLALRVVSQFPPIYAPNRPRRDSHAATGTPLKLPSRAHCAACRNLQCSTRVMC
jgi:hypothetical protein